MANANSTKITTKQRTNFDAYQDAEGLLNRHSRLGLVVVVRVSARVQIGPRIRHQHLLRGPVSCVANNEVRVR